MTKIPLISPLRGIAAVLVLISHVAFWSGTGALDGIGPLLARGDAGVAVFFALSAFLLTYQADGHDRLGVKAYWVRRFGRIFPGYWLALVAVLAVAAWLGDVGSVGKIAAHMLLLQGYTGDAYQGFTQTWSLTTEVTFYLLVPVIGAWLRSFATDSRWGPIPVLAGVSIASLVVQTMTASSGNASLGWVSTSVIGHAAWFCVGIGLAWWHAQGRNVSVSTARLVGLAVGVYVLAATPLGGPTDLATPGVVSAFSKELLYALLAGLLVSAAIWAGERVQSRGDASLPQLAGDISYGLFLWHVLVIQVLFHALGLSLFHEPFVLVLIPTVVISVALASTSWVLLERRAIRWARRVG